MRRVTLVAALAFIAVDAALVAWLVGPGDVERPSADAAPIPPVVRRAVVRPSPAPPPPTAVAPVPPDDDLAAFERLGPSSSGDWRSNHPDDVALPFEDYVECGPVRADETQRVVAFLPVGDFPADKRAALDAATEFTGIWFDLPVRVLPSVPLTDDEDQFRVREALVGNGRQYRTRWFLNTLLPDKRPDDAVVLIGVTMADLYPDAAWNYVFGEANLRRRVGVYSLVRYFDDFWGWKRSPEGDLLALVRTLKVVVHETGHTFGLEHCVEWKCAMNGINSLGESDTKPLHLCPTCLKKLAWNRGFDVTSRYRRLAEFLDAHGLADDAAWNRARAAARR